MIGSFFVVAPTSPHGTRKKETEPAQLPQNDKQRRKSTTTGFGFRRILLLAYIEQLRLCHSVYRGASHSAAHEMRRLRRSTVTVHWHITDRGSRSEPFRIPRTTKQVNSEILTLITVTHGQDQIDRTMLAVSLILRYR